MAKGQSKSASGNSKPKAPVKNVKTVKPVSPAVVMEAPASKVEEPKAAAPDMKTASTPASLMDILKGQNLQTLEILAKGLAEVTGRVGTMGGKMMEDSMAEDARPFKADPYGLNPYAADVAARLASSPEKMLAAQQALWSGYAEIWMGSVKDMMGEGDAISPTKDKRFADPDWQTIPMFNMLQKTYLHTASWFTGLVEQVDGVDDMTRRKATFFTKQ